MSQQSQSDFSVMSSGQRSGDLRSGDPWGQLQCCNRRGNASYWLSRPGEVPPPPDHTFSFVIIIIYVFVALWVFFFSSAVTSLQLSINPDTRVIWTDRPTT